MDDSDHTEFARYGRTVQLRIRNAGDLERVVALDDALWMATSAPLTSLNSDAVFCQLLDPDRSSRILSSEVRLAIKWTLDVFLDRHGITDASTSLRLGSLDPNTSDGKRVLDSASKILRQLGTPDSDSIELAGVRAIKSRTESLPVSEAGVVLPEAADSDRVREFLSDVIRTTGGAPHPSGKHGVNAELLASFLSEARAHLAWLSEVDLVPDSDESPLMPLREDTPQAYRLFKTLQPKIDQYFSQCTAVAFDPRTLAHIHSTEPELATLDLSSPEAVKTWLGDAPLAPPTPEGVLRINGLINPSYATQLNRFHEKVLTRLMDDMGATLTRARWQSVKSQFAPHEDWMARQPSKRIAPLGRARLEPYLDPFYDKTAQALIAESDRTALELDSIRVVEKAILLQANLLRLLNNFVSFPYLYDPNSRAVFEMGTLVMDGRRFSFSVRVEDRADHARVAATSHFFLLYARVFAGGKDKPNYEIAVPVTSGSKGNLCIGKRGVFEDVNGRQYDAQIVQIIENPISIGEALLSPYQRLARLLSGKIESMTSSAEKNFDSTAATILEEPASKPPPTGHAAGTAPAAGNILMGGGVAIAAMGSAMAYVTSTLANIKPHRALLGVLIAALAIIVPTAIVAILKLRSRDLSAILEGSGWAINGRMRLRWKLAHVFTSIPPFPEGATGVRSHLRVRVLLAILTAEILVLWIAAAAQ